MHSARCAAACITALLAMGAFGCAHAETPVAPDFGLVSPGAFCPDGGWQGAPGKPAHLKTFGSFCTIGDANTGTATTTSFPAPGNLTLYLAGYPNGKDLNLLVENPTTGEKFSVVPPRGPADTWRRYTFALPRDWHGKQIQLRAFDNATAVRGWFAFSEPIAETGEPWGIRDAFALLITAVVHFLLLALPAAAACAWAAAKGIRNPVALAAIALIAIAAIGYLGFWIYLLSPELGSHFGVDLAIAAAMLFAFQFRNLASDARNALRPLILPALLVGCAALLILSTGFLYEGISAPLDTPMRRFSHELPPDNRIPFLFAEHLHQGEIPRPLLGDWLSSDRPPLQTGIALSQYAFMGRRDFAYTVLAVILQSLWIFAAWSVLQSFRPDSQAAAIALAVTLFSGFVFVNTFFVWPKLLGAVFLLALAAHLYEIEQGRMAADRTASILAGALGAFALLSHGGSTFGLLGILLMLILIGRRRLNWRAIGIAAAALIAIYLPWTLYQKVLDPPGDRLQKMHLAGIEKLDNRPFIQDWFTAYASAGVPVILRNKANNAAVVFHYSADNWKHWASLLGGSSSPGGPAAALRGSMFFDFFPTLGLLALGLPALALGIRAKNRSPEWTAAARLWLLIAATDVVWILLMFGPGTTILHQGTYLTVILAFMGGALALWAVSPSVARILAATQMALFFWLYFYLMREPLTNGALAEGVARPLLGLLALAALAGTIAILVRMAFPRHSETAN